MNAWDYVIIAAVAIAAGFAVYSVIKRRKSGKGCCEDCSRCEQNCCTDKNASEKK